MAHDLIPKAEKWMDENFNVMLIGYHGVGKTEYIMELCKRKGVKMKYFSCSTLDPFTDLVGVPFARTDDEGNEYLKMVRPREIDEAEIIFMDEFNRADSKVHNALMEIIQFKTINGEPLPNLRMVWAAMNPPGDDYDVEELDPALLDRFDCFEDVQGRPSVEYMVSVGIRESVAKAIIAWWQEQNRSRRKVNEAISPRRLVKIGMLYEKTGDFKPAIPNWFNIERQKLRAMLEDVEAREKAEGGSKGGNAQQGAYRGFEYNPEYLTEHAVEVAEYLEKNQGDLETNRAVSVVVAKRQASRMIRDFGQVLNAMTPSVREALLTNMAPAKFNNVVSTIETEVEDWQKPLLTDLLDAIEEQKNVREGKEG